MKVWSALEKVEKKWGMVCCVPAVTWTKRLQDQNMERDGGGTQGKGHVVPQVASPLDGAQ